MKKYSLTFALALLTPVTWISVPVFGEESDQACTFIASTEITRKNGLGAQVLFVSKNQEAKELVASVILDNQGEQDLYIALIPPAPQAFDNQGASYTFHDDKLGIGSCEWIDNRRDECLENKQDALQPGEFTKLESGSAVLTPLVFQNNVGGKLKQISETGLLALSFNLAVSEGAPPVDEDPADVNRGLDTVNISFPLIPLDSAFDQQNEICIKHE
ncbi:MAG: hypothetical protein OXE84_11380 [Rhodobacteraceae bacterium]|nr:hypothetical protein [Paracoccaceae bacterium]MCY4196226.1 hypothetical protein [Paracoccaceae bacterium]